MTTPTPKFPNATHVSPHFTWAELRMDPAKTPPDIKARMVRHCYDVLEPIRVHFGKPVTITSGYRAKALQAELYAADVKEHGGKPSGKVAAPGHSRHEFGDATDIHIPGVPPAKVLAFALTLPSVGGASAYPTFTHVDSRPRNGGAIARW